jgi:nicotinamidase-related amidase
MPDDLLEQVGEHAALLVVDLQNDFADPRGTLAVAGAEQILPIINDLVRRAERSDPRVLHAGLAPAEHAAFHQGGWRVARSLRTR